MKKEIKIKTKKIKNMGELAYILGALIMGIGNAMMAKANLGVSCVVAPAYIISLKVPFLTFGMAEYFVQAMVVIILSLVLQKFNWRYLLSFLSALIYGTVLDVYMKIVPDISLLPFDRVLMQIIYFAVGEVIVALSVAFYFRTYLPQQVYDMAVKRVSNHFSIDINKFKICYDIGSFAFSVILSLLLFHSIKGIGIGTVICAFINGILVSLWGRLLDKTMDFSPKFQKYYNFFTDKVD